LIYYDVADNSGIFETMII